MNDGEIETLADFYSGQIGGRLPDTIPSTGENKAEVEKKAKELFEHILKNDDELR
ncbi:MAG: hypothetical protein OXH31_00150 [Gammaproteobacteria bacterium]|nr:hypothetical protein [Gammaproteobacteria bacterium]